MYRDMHLGVYNLTRRLGEVVRALNPSSPLKATIGAAALSTYTFAADRQPQLKPARDMGEDGHSWKPVLA